MDDHRDIVGWDDKNLKAILPFEPEEDGFVVDWMNISRTGRMIWTECLPPHREIPY